MSWMKKLLLFFQQQTPDRVLNPVRGKNKTKFFIFVQ